MIINTKSPGRTWTVCHPNLGSLPETKEILSRLSYCVASWLRHQLWCYIQTSLLGHVLIYPDSKDKYQSIKKEALKLSSSYYIGQMFPTNERV